MRIRTITIGLAILATTGCTAGRHTSHNFQAPNGVKCAYHNYTANLYGPGLRRSDLLCDGDPGFIGLAHASGPDAGVALGTAGLQGAGIAGGAAVLGVSFPTNKRSSTNVSSAGGAGGNASSDSHDILATDNYVTSVGAYNVGAGGPPSAGGR